MQRSFIIKDRRGLLFSLLFLGLVAALVFLPNQFVSEAGSKNNVKKGLLQRTESHEEGIENYDIREDVKHEQAVDALANFRQKSTTNAAAIADVREKFVRGEEQLRTSIPNLVVEYNNDIRIPEVIGTDVMKLNISFLTSPSDAKHSEILRNFVKSNNNLIGVTNEQANGLKVVADYTNPDGNLSYAHLEQRINDIPVFRGEIKAGFTRNGEMFRIINNLAPGLEYARLSTDFRNPLDAVKVAAKTINYELKSGDVTRNDAVSTDLKTVFGNGDWATTAEKMYFPTEPGVAVPAWRILIWEPVNAYYVIVDAETGTMLWRKNITNDQTQTATFNVYTNPANMMNVSKNPAPIVPGILDPGLGTQGAIIPRNNVTLIGNEAPNTFNNNGWITDGAGAGNGITDGNAVEAGLDIDGINGVDAPVTGTTRTFNFVYNPGPGNPAPGDAPTLPAFRNGAVTQLFYINNRYHDELYKLGFTEAARNFQTTNFTGMGVGNDRVSAEAQDSSGTNNANFATPADGGRGRMQMYVFTGPTPDYDGDIDADIVVHEHTHGLSNRLIGNGSGLGNNRGGSMGEGWSDFYGLSLLSVPTTPAGSINTTGDWATYLLTATYTYNYYYGIRRFPYALRSFTGGPGNLPHSPQTFADIDAAQINNSDGAFPRNPTFSNTATEVHNAGEIWCTALFEVRGRFIARLGATVGNQKTLQLVTDGMKLTPSSPNFIQARDAIIAAAQASAATPEAGVDAVDVREGFRIRGMGFGAVDNNTSVIESFVAPNVFLTTPFSVSDSTGNNNGVPEPGENVLLSIAVNNPTGATVNNVTVAIDGGTPVSYGNIASGATTTMQIPYLISAAAPCGSTVNVSIVVSSDLGSQAPAIRSFVLGSPVGTVENFDGVTAPNLPAGWTTTQDVGTGITWVTTATGPSSAPNSAFANDPAAVNMSSLVSPNVPISSTSAQLKFKNKYITESTFDGMVLEMKIGAGAFQDILAAGGSFVSGGYNGAISTAFMSPIAGRMAWNGTSAGGYVDTVVNLPAAANGQMVQFRWRMASDSSVASTGVNVDDVQIVSGFNCVAPGIKSRADFDNDGKTDLSVFRPSEGNWYLNRSTAGFQVLHWGISTDVLVPGDYDGDGKTDTAVFRVSPTPGVSDYFVLNSNGFTVSGAEWGTTGDIAVSGNYDGDTKTDFAVFRPSNSTWYVLNSSNGSNTIEPFGVSGDVPLAIDNNADGKTNLAVFRPSNNTWYIAKPTGVPATNFDAIPFGMVGDLLVPADYDNDNKEDVAVFRPSNGTWYILRSTNGATDIRAFGQSGDVPVPGDYDGDGADDIAVYRGGTWYVNRSTSGLLIQAFGLGSDKAIPKAYIP